MTTNISPGLCLRGFAQIPQNCLLEQLSAKLNSDGETLIISWLHLKMTQNLSNSVEAFDLHCYCCGATFVKVMPLKQNVKWCHLKRNQILESSKVSTGKSGHVWKQHFDGEKKHGKLPPTPATVTFSQKWHHQAVTARGKNTVNLRKKQVFAGVA